MVNAINISLVSGCKTNGNGKNADKTITRKSNAKSLPWPF